LAFTQRQVEVLGGEPPEVGRIGRSELQIAEEPHLQQAEKLELETLRL
jgi:hypothetical protein